MRHASSRALGSVCEVLHLPDNSQCSLMLLTEGMFGHPAAQLNG